MSVDAMRSMVVALVMLANAPAAAQGGRVELRFDPTMITSSGSGTVETDVLAQQVTSTRARIEACPGRATRDDPPSGVLRIEISVGEHGVVQSVRALSNDTGAPRVASCLVRVFRSFRFPPRTSGTVTYTVRLELVVRAHDPLASPGPAPSPASWLGSVDARDVRSEGAGSFDPGALVRMFQVRRAAMGHCYQRIHDAMADLGTGPVTVALTIEPSGDVTDVHVVTSTLASTEVGACVVRVVQGFRFNPGAVGGAVAYTVPITFVPVAIEGDARRRRQPLR